MSQLISNPWIQAIDANGDPYSGAKLQTQDEGTSDDRTTYSDAALSTPNANPLIADSAGLFGPIFLAASETGLKLTLSESDDTLIDTVDNIPVGTVAAPYIEITAAETAAGATIVDSSLRPGNVDRYETNTTPGTTDMTVAIQTAFDSGAEPYIVGDCLFSSDLTITADDITVSGPGTLVAESGSGANIEITGDNVCLNVRVTGNENKTFVIDAKSTTPDTITSDTSYTWTNGDQIVVKTTDSFERLIWAGSIDSFAGDVLTVSTNTIDGAFADVAVSQTAYIVDSAAYQGEIRFNGCENPSVGPNFNGSSRDLVFYNCNHVSHGPLQLLNANLNYQFCYNTVAGDVISDNSRYYGRVIQACLGGSWGTLHAVSPLFSGQVIKGLHDGEVDDCYVYNAPVMTLQLTTYPGSIPSSVNGNLQGDLLNSNVKLGHLHSENGNWVAALKGLDTLKIASVYATGGYKSFFIDQSISDGVIIDGDLIVDSHNLAGGNTANSGAAVYAGDGKRFVVNGRLRVNDCDVDSGANGVVYITGISEQVYIQHLDIEGCEQFANITTNGDVVIDLITTRDNIDGFQVVSTTANDSFYVGRLIAYESLNGTMERVLFAASGDNIAVENFKITYDSASISSAVEGIRYDSAGQNLSVRNGYAEALDTASCSHAFRNTGAGDHVLVSGVREGAGLTNAVAASNVTDYLQIINCQGTISDTTGGITNKDVATGNI